ncbi:MULTISPECIES: hypothetical protein [unclassified Streptomyces]|uniref:hypothetical protein n=1 Tax=unclassified Streptomyces TaxID=2593676 RepID=UPI0036FF9A1D
MAAGVQAVFSAVGVDGCGVGDSTHEGQQDVPGDEALDGYRGPCAFQEAAGALGGPRDDLLVAKLDVNVNVNVTGLDDARAAVQAAGDRFGRIGVLISNAGNFYAGFFEEMSPQHMRR